MTPGAIVAAAIEALEAQAAAGAPLDAALGRYQRDRRYIGAKDRAALAARVYGAVRRQARLDWRLAAVGADPTPRLRVLADLVLEDGLEPMAVQAMLASSRHGPPPLDDAEFLLLAALGAGPLETDDMPDAVRFECPDWAWPGFQAAFGAAAGDELRALQAEAPLDLRVNRLKGDVAAALAAIRDIGVDAARTPYSPIGIRLPQRIALGRLPGLADGLLEPQDEGSQLVALAVGAEAGEQVVDFCAGAGGKTLALAAEMGNRGQIHALDVDGRRLEQCARRAAKAGADTIQRRVIAAGADGWLKRRRGGFDRVLVDAPCSGVGAWRRNPDARWSRRQPALAELTALQSSILDRAARLVRPGGLLVYATCSLLPEENADQVHAFLARSPAFRLDPPADFPAPLDGPFLQLTPARHGTDGFFVAWLRRSESTASPAEDAPA